MPEFDDWGLWAYRNVRFSRAGTLPETLVALVTRAPTGLTVGELEQRLQTPVANLLSRLVRQGHLQRQVLRQRLDSPAEWILSDLLAGRAVEVALERDPQPRGLVGIALLGSRSGI